MEINRLRRTFGACEATLRTMERHLAAHLARLRCGPPMRHALRFILLVPLMRLRTALPLRLLARLFATDHVTLWRYCGLVMRFLSSMFESPGGVRKLTASTRPRRGAKRRRRLVFRTQEATCCEAVGPVRRHWRRPFRLSGLRRQRPRQGDLEQEVRQCAERRDGPWGRGLCRWFWGG